MAMGSNAVVIVVFVIYVVALFVISVMSSKTVKSQEDFIIGGRNIGWLGTALSAAASSNSAGTMVAHAGSAFLVGLQFHWVSMGIVMIESLNMYLVMSPRIRNFAGHKNVMTIPDYYKQRFKKMGSTLQAVTATIIVLFMISYLVAQFKGMSFTIQSVMGWPFAPAVIVSAIIVTIYTFAGGYVAVVWTDVIQGILMLGAMILMPVLAITNAGGFTNAMNAISTINPDMLLPIGSMGVFYAIGMGFSALGSGGNPHIITRYLSVKNRKEIRKAGLMTVIFDSIVTYGAVIVGFFGRVIFTDPAMLPDGNSELIYYQMANKLIPNQIILGLIYAAIFAAIMSTIDSMLLVVSSTVVRDFWENIINKGKPLDTAFVLKVNRITVVVVAAIAMIGTFFAPAGILVLSLFAWAGVGCSIGPPIMVSLWYKKTTGIGALCGVLAGLITAMAFQFMPSLQFMYGGPPAFVVSVIVTLLVSMATASQAEDEEITDCLTTVAPDMLEDI